MPASPSTSPTVADPGVEASESETDDAAAAVVKKTVFQKIVAAPFVAVSAVGKAGGTVGRLITGAGKNKKAAVSKETGDEGPTEKDKQPAEDAKEAAAHDAEESTPR